MKFQRQLIFVILGILLLVEAAGAKKVPSVELFSDGLFFSPNKDLVRDELRFELKVKHIKSVTAWELQIRDFSEVVQKTVSGVKEVPESVSWNGLDEFGAPCPEGSYSVSFKAWDKQNQQFEAASLRIVLDLTPPTISLTSSVKTLLIKDQTLAPVTFYFSAVDLSGVLDWKLDFLNKNQQVYFTETSTFAPPSFWIFPNSEVRMPVGKNSMVLYVTDQAGNKGSSPPLEIDVRESLRPPPQLQPEVESPKSIRGPFLQLTTIMALSDLFGNNADRQSSLLPQSSVLLNPIAEAMLSSPDARATILGHVDLKETAQSSKELSSYFAWRVFSYLVKEKEVEKSRISVKGLGADVPIADQKTALGRSRNRRIEIQLFLPVQE